MALPDRPHIAILGATGAVGGELLAQLESRGFPHGDIRLLASARSAGRTVNYRGTTLRIEEANESAFDRVDLAFFAAGGSVSKALAPAAIKAGAVVIDKTSAFRMDPEVPLVIPEVNARALDGFETPGIIAVPNCSTIIALMAVSPLHRAVGIQRMVVSTYQSASGAGAATMRELEQQAHDHVAGRPYTQKVIGRQYLFNLYSHDTPIGPEGYNTEEMKLVRETHKIWNDDAPAITATCVRVPVLRCHAESINLTFANPLREDDARRILSDAPGVKVVDDREANRFPEPIAAAQTDDVLVGRIRGDISQPAGMGLDLFVCGDQLRKGAALNAVQIAETLIGKTVTV